MTPPEATPIATPQVCPHCGGGFLLLQRDQKLIVSPLQGPMTKRCVRCGGSGPATRYGELGICPNCLEQMVADLGGEVPE
jgi:hypothetical protein